MSKSDKECCGGNCGCKSDPNALREMPSDRLKKAIQNVRAVNNDMAKWSEDDIRDLVLAVYAADPALSLWAYGEMTLPGRTWITENLLSHKHGRAT